MKKLVPVLIALVGLGVGTGAGVALRPQAEDHASVCAVSVEDDGHPTAGAADPPCPTGDPFADTSAGADSGEKPHLTYIPIEKPFVVPIFAGERTVAMVVLSVSIAAEGETGANEVEAVQPRLRDSFLKVMFRHANSGGFDGSYTSGRKIEDLKSALLLAAREVVRAAPVDEVLITGIARQDS